MSLNIINLKSEQTKKKDVEFHMVLFWGLSSGSDYAKDKNDTIVLCISPGERPNG